MTIDNALNTASNWLQADPLNFAYAIGAVIGTIAVIGAINGFRNSLNRASYSRHIGRRVL